MIEGMEKTKSFKEMIVWQKAHQFTMDVYSYTKNFPREEVFGLTSQFRRAAVSIAANIAEGYAKQSKKDKARFYNIAQGSLEECRYYVLLSKDLQYGENEKLDSLAEEISKILCSYIKAIKSDLTTHS